jgi:DNA-binding GntR family transcriptional regulator
MIASGLIAGRLAPNDAYEKLKRLILTCSLKPGERLIENDVAAQIGMSRSDVHKAFDRLMYERLVDVVPRKGVVVRPIIIAELLETAEIRRINEVYAVKKAAELITPEQLEAIGSIVRSARAAVEADDIMSMVQLDGSFHRTLAECSGNAEVTEMVTKLGEWSCRYWYVSSTSKNHHRKFQEQHMAIYEALVLHDPQVAGNLMNSHIDSFRDSLVRHICASN